MAGEERSIVSPIPGTTIDSVDTDVARDGRHYRFVDTAGNSAARGKTNLVAEKLSVVMAKARTGTRRRGTADRGPAKMGRYAGRTRRLRCMRRSPGAVSLLL